MNKRKKRKQSEHYGGASFEENTWNVVGALVLGGVSLAEDYPHLLVTSFSGAPLLSGGACKIEGRLIVLLVNVSLMAVFAVLRRKRKAA